MSVVMSALHTVQVAATHAAIAFAATDGEEFNPDKVTPGPEGFIATAVFAAAVIVLGFLLVKRIRRNSYRHEIRDEIAAELAEAGTAADGSPAAGGSDAQGPAAEGSGSRTDGA